MTIQEGDGAKAQTVLRAEHRAEAEALGLAPTEDEMQALRSGEDHALGEIGYLLSPAGWSDDFLVAWLTAPNAYLDGARPITLLREQPGYLDRDMVYAAYRAVPRAARIPR